jgi:hypothetical protein
MRNKLLIFFALYFALISAGFLLPAGSTQQRIGGSRGALSGLTSGQYLKATGAASASTDGVKRYVALLTQTGAGNPTATVLENSLGGAVAWQRTGVGIYVGTFDGAFTANKTALFVSNNDAPGADQLAQFSLRRFDEDTLTLATLAASWSGTEAPFADDLLSGTTVEVRVYP